MSNGKSGNPTDGQPEGKEAKGQPLTGTQAPASNNSDNDDEGELEAILAGASEGSLSREQQQKVAKLLSVTVSHHEAFSGPYPHPHLLAQYPEWVQDEICWLTRSYHEHQKETDTRDRDTARRERKRGQDYGLCIALAGLLATVIISFTSPMTATVVGALDLLGLTAVFAYPRYLESKKQSSPEQTDKDS